MKQKAILTLIISLVFISEIAHGQTSPIDFKALAAAEGASPTRFHDFDGSDKLQSTMRRVAAVETDRTSSRAAARGSYSGSDSSSSSSGTGKSAAPPQRNSNASKKFICKIYCNSASGPTIRKEIIAPSRREAANIASNTADSLCRSDGYSRSSSHSFSEDQCHEN